MQNPNGIAILGAGTMGRAIALGLLRTGEADAVRLKGTVRHEERARAAAETLGIDVGTDNPGCVRGAGLVLLCVKPHLVAPVLAELAESGALEHDPLVVSIAAGVRTSDRADAADPTDIADSFAKRARSSG